MEVSLRTAAPLAPALAFAFAASGCIAPSSTSDIEVAGTTITPTSSVFAVVTKTFEQLLGGNRTEDVAVVLLGDRACEDIPTDCSAPATGPHVAIELILNESLLGQTQLGDYDLPIDGSWTAQLDEGATAFAQDGNIDLIAIDGARFVATYDVTVQNDERVVGDVVAESCARWEENRTACE